MTVTEMEKIPYEVQKGDSLIKLSYLFKTTVKTILRLNDFLSEDQILPEGMVL